MSEAAVPRTLSGAYPYAQLPTVVVTRPNDVTAYAIGDVYGDAADARVPIAGFAPTRRISVLRMYMVQSRAASEVSLVNLTWLPFSAQPATVIGDNSPLALSDADIALAAAQIGSSGVVAVSASFNQNSTNWLNNAAGIAGRRAAIFNVVLPTPASGTLWLYLFNITAYVPLALETVTIFPFVQYAD